MVILFLFVMVSVVLHVKSFTLKHHEGDELVFLGLAQEMNFDLTHYTTMHHPQVNKFPSPTYRHVLFIHPPFYPYLLKIGSLFKAKLVTGLLVQSLSMILLLLVSFLALRKLKLGDVPTILVLLLMLFCPIMLYSTTKIHTDGLFGIYSFAAFVFLIDALEKPTWGKSFFSAFLLAIALNIKFTSVILLPGVFFVQGFMLYRKADSPDRSALKRVLLDWQNWKHFVLIMAIVATFGLQHHIRFAITFKTIMPWKFIGGEKEAMSWNAFTRSIFRRTRWHMAWYLLAIFPCFLILFFKTFWDCVDRLWQKKDPALLYMLLFAYFFLVVFTLQHKQMRYFAVVMPFFYVTYGIVLAQVDRSTRTILYGLLAISLVLMIVTGYTHSILKPNHAKIIPSLVYYWPFLGKFYL